MTELLLCRDKEELLRVPLDGSPFSVGREDGNGLVVPGVALREFSIERSRGKWIFSDLTRNCMNESGTVIRDGTEITFSNPRYRAIFREKLSPDTTLHRKSDPISITPSEPVKLFVVTKDKTEEAIPFSGTAVIGRGEKCTVRVSDEWMSTEHARLEQKNNSCFILTDLASKNGTFIRESRIWKAEVPIGAIFQIGKTEFVLRRLSPDGELATFEGMVGTDASMRRVYNLVDRAAPTPFPVIILGETGTGKEMVAQALHARKEIFEKIYIID
jgi:hypothetical protein